MGAIFEALNEGPLMAPPQIGLAFLSCRIFFNRAPQLEKDFQWNGDGGKASQNDSLRLGPRSFRLKQMT